MDSPPVISRFQKRLASLAGGGMLLGLGLRKRSPPWEGVALLATACLLLSVSFLSLQADREKQTAVLVPK